MNLTAITDPEAVDRLHFEDSLACLLEPIATGASVVDVGAGAGLPGLPLKIARPDLRLTLIEATAKKTRFLEHVTEVLGLTDVQIVNDRAETAAAALRERFDVAVVRALAAMPALLELTLPFVSVGGKLLALKKGGRLAAELKTARRALEVLGGELAEPRTYTLAGEERQVIVVRKVHTGPAAYPRRPGLPAKKPL